MMNSIVTRVNNKKQVVRNEERTFLTQFVKNNDDFQYYKVEMIPLVGIEYFLYNYEEIYSILNKYQDIFNETIPRLENNTTIDMKFYNTYGPAIHHYIDTVVDTEIPDSSMYLSVCRSDILLDFNIYLYEEIDDEIDAAIKKFISDFVEACNEEGLIAISNLIRLLEIHFPVIKFIEYNGLTGEYDTVVSNKYQKVEDKDINFVDMTKQEIIEYVPEYMNVKKGLRNYSIITDENVEIKLGQSYEYTINITYK